MPHRRMLAPINSEKHYVNQTLGNVGPGVLTSVQIVAAVQAAAKDAANEVNEGSIVKAVFVEMWISSDDATQSSWVLSVEKLPGGNTAMTYAQSILMGTYPNKKNILYTTMGLAGQKIGSPIPVIRQYIKIPKGKQRFGLGDTLRLNISGITDGINFCGFYTYKEYN